MLYELAVTVVNTVHKSVMSSFSQEYIKVS